MVSTSFLGVLTKFRALTWLQRQTFSSLQPKLSMNTVYFRHQTEEKQFQINFRYVNEGFGIDRKFNLLRNENEKVDVCLERIRTNVEKEFTKRMKKHKKKPKKGKETDDQLCNEEPQDSTLVSVKMVRNGVPINELNLLEIASSADDVELHILDEPFVVAFNVPWISSITLPSSILATFYVYPSQMEMQCSNSDETLFEWYRGKQVS